MPLLTISDAARVCGVNRRTLQRAIQAGRLSLTAGHRIDTADLRRAGYPVPVSQLDAAGIADLTAPDTAPTPQDDAALLSQAIRDLTAALEAILEAVNAIRGHVLSQGDTAGTPHHVTVTPQDTPQIMSHDAAPVPHHDALTPQEPPQAVAETPHVTPQESATGDRPLAPLTPHLQRIAEVAAQYERLSLAELSQLLFDRGIYRAKDRKTGAAVPVNRGTLGRWLEQARQAGGTVEEESIQ